MRVLLDECLPRKAKQYFSGHSVSTSVEMGWSGFANGRLLAAVTGHFDFFITVDRNLQFQQIVESLAFGVVVISAKSNRLSDLRPALEKIPLLLVESNVGKLLTVS